VVEPPHGIYEELLWWTKVGDSLRRYALRMQTSNPGYEYKHTLNVPDLSTESPALKQLWREKARRLILQLKEDGLIIDKDSN
jgi:hypothetical protein